MAIGFARVEIIKAGQGSSAVGLSSYMTREARDDLATGEHYNFEARQGDLIAKGVALPDGAHDRFRDGGTLWNEATSKEMTFDRKAKEWRFKKDAQVAKHMVLALPKELTDVERLDLTERFAKEQFAKHGVAVEWAVHGPDGDNDNHHAHLLISTRELGSEGFGKKARHLNPSFAFDKRTGIRFVSDQDHWEVRWTVAQNNYFAEHGIDLTVDPFKAVPEWHKGKAHHMTESEIGAAIAERNRLAKEVVQQAPEVILEALTHQNATFTERDIDRYLHKHKVAGSELERIKRTVLDQSQIVPLYDRETLRPTGRYTTSHVRAQEARIMARIQSLKALDRGADAVAVVQIAKAKGLDAEQAVAMRQATGADGVAVIQGRAGTGKSYTIGAIRDAYEASGYRVVGLAPTNTVARDMETDGFRHARTVHKELFDIEKGNTAWDRRTVIIVDEAAMVDTKRYDALTRRADEAGAKLILVGDDRQLDAVQRGGIFSQVAGQAGAAEITTVRRQVEEWQRDASEDFAAGKMAEGLKAYSDHGMVHWHDQIDESRAQLLKDWTVAHSADPARTRFVYASTNAQVDTLNAELRQVRLNRGEIGSGRRFKTSRGEIEVSTGDRIQFYGNQKRAGVVNGTLGTVEQVNGNRLAVQLDGGKRIEFEVGEDKKRGQTNEFGHGYAGTVYRGQGKTQPQVFALYDNRYAWNARTAYVGMTRHKAEVSLYVSRDLAKTEKHLARQMSKTVEAGASIKFATEAERSQAVERLRQVRQPEVKRSTSVEIGAGTEAAPVTIDDYRQAVTNLDRAARAGGVDHGQLRAMATEAQQIAGRLAADNPNIVAETMAKDNALAIRLSLDVTKGQEMARGISPGDKGLGY